MSGYEVNAVTRRVFSRSKTPIGRTDDSGGLPIGESTLRVTGLPWLYETIFKVYISVSTSLSLKPKSMPHPILADVAASISELKANPMKVVASGHGMPIAVLNHNEPAFYCVPAAAYEALMELLDDIELLKLVKARADEPSVKVTLDDL